MHVGTANRSCVTELPDPFSAFAQATPKEGKDVSIELIKVLGVVKIDDAPYFDYERETAQIFSRVIPRIVTHCSFVFVPGATPLSGWTQRKRPRVMSSPCTPLSVLPFHRQEGISPLVFGDHTTLSNYQICRSPRL